MNRFVSTFTMRLDAKGRVSIPASFRAVLARDGFEGLYCHPALDRPALDAGGNALLSEIETLKPDSEGRIILTDTLKAHTGISDSASFVGLGHKFQIWEPKRLNAHLAEANEKIRALKKSLGSLGGAGEPSGASG